MAPRVWRALAPSRRALGKGLSAIQAVFDGVWLGLLGPDELAAADEHFYGADGDVAALYRGEDHNSRGFYDWEEDLVDRFLEPGASVVVTAAGGGREVLALARKGMRVAAFEPNAVLVDAGRRLLGDQGVADASLDTCPRDVFPPDAPECDAVVVGWGSYIHIQGRARRVALLRGARSRLQPGAPILLSFWVRPAGARYFKFVRRIARPIRALRGLPPPELGDTVSETYVHWFDRREVEEELVAAGFDPVHYQSTPYGHAVGVATG